MGTIVFDAELLGNLRANNYFGQDGHEDEIAGLWLDRLPYNQGDEIDTDEFETAAQRALAVAIARWNTGERV
jgi:hypothetical protein